MEYVFKVGPLGLRWYSLLVVAGLLLGSWIATIEARRRGEDPNHVFDALLIALPLALVGARAYHVIDQWDEIYRHDPISVFFINEGGIGIYGAIAGGILGVALYARLKKLSLPAWLDIAAPALILGQAIGRWGNFFNQELYGRPTTLPWAISIPPEKRLVGYGQYSTFHPLFLYESVLDLLAFGALMYIGRKYQAHLVKGDLALSYGVFYGVIRLALEPLRIGNWLVDGVPVATIISAAAVLGCGGALLFRHLMAPKRGPEPEATALP